MATVNESNLTDVLREGFKTTPGKFFEDEAHLYHAFMVAKNAQKINFKQWRLPYVTERAGGQGWFQPSNADFNPAKAPQTTSMYVGVFYYALPMVFQGNVMRALQQNSKDAALNLAQTLEMYTDAATKDINRMVAGTGDASVAYSSSTLSSVGAGQTLNCTTAAQTTSGQTKGACWLQQNQVYNAINTTTGAIRGTFTVTAIGSASCTVNLTFGTVSSGDPIVTLNSYQKALRGINYLVSDIPRVLQGLNTATVTDLNASTIDLNGEVLTPFGLYNLRSYVATRCNNKKKAMGFTGIITIGQKAKLASQGYGFRQDTSMGKNGMSGITMSYDEPGVTWVVDADWDEDRVTLIANGEIERYEEMPFGQFDADNQEWRMLLGINNTGSDNYQKALGMAGNLGISNPRYCGLLKRAAISGVATQVNANAR